MFSIRSRLSVTFTTALLLLNLLIPAKSEAGIILLATSGGASGMLIAGGAATVIGASGLLPNMSADFDQYDVRFYHAIGIVLIALDADGGLARDQIQTALQKKYPFIDQPEVFRQLSQLIKAKAETLSYLNGEKRVSISRTELSSLLAAIDLRGFETQVEQMAQDLE